MLGGADVKSKEVGNVSLHLSKLWWCCSGPTATDTDTADAIGTGAKLVAGTGKEDQSSSNGSDTLLLIQAGLQPPNDSGF